MDLNDGYQADMSSPSMGKQLIVCKILAQFFGQILLAKMQTDVF